MTRDAFSKPCYIFRILKISFYIGDWRPPYLLFESTNDFLDGTQFVFCKHPMPKIRSFHHDARDCQFSVTQAFSTH
ncbi:hypothetical protein AWB79_05093 [Caballeronia hypogeia]|uniref:Uncharacterized protein n=1 Tax=Caballeronia hypogeia TaxID=1777140 RepID=A0A158CBN0_9BURK|nr:hypothetical protein AWB79_05093 [Caballeronia hypogeia]